MRVKIDRDLCMSAGTCFVLAPNTFEPDDELKAKVKKSAKQNPENIGGKDSEEDIIAAAKSCPVLAIILESDEGKQTFP